MSTVHSRSPSRPKSRKTAQLRGFSMAILGACGYGTAKFEQLVFPCITAGLPRLPPPRPGLSRVFCRVPRFFHPPVKKTLAFFKTYAIMPLLPEKPADVAQSVERILGKDEVTSSNLVISSTNPAGMQGFLWVLGVKLQDFLAETAIWVLAGAGSGGFVNFLVN